MNDITNLNKLLPEEVEELRSLYLAWQSARNEKRWGDADKLRSQFYWWDTEQGCDGIWSPHFEYDLNRQRRAFLRMRKYKIDVYPWTLDETKASAD